jgi:hypothetical protein
LITKYSGRRTIAILAGGAVAGWGLVALVADAFWLAIQN